MSAIPAGPIDHVGIAVHDLDKACATYQGLLGAELVAREAVTAQGVEVAFLKLPGAARVELISPIDPEGSVATFLAKRGEGMHHVCILVTDLASVLADLVAKDVPLIDTAPRIGALNAKIAFVHPVALGGVLLELKEKRPDASTTP